MKKSKRNTLNKNFYFTIYSLIKEDKNPSQICSILNCKKQALNYYIRYLKANGYIEKIGYGVWKTSKTFDFNFIPRKSKNIRSHAFIFSVQLPRIKNWEKRTEILKKNKIKFEKFKNRDQEKLIYKGYKIQISKKKIVIYFNKWKSYFVTSAKTGENYAFYDLSQLLISLENLFKVSFKTNKEYKFKVGRRHHALINSELARMFNREHKKLYVYDKEGILRLLIDNSFVDGIGMNEEEAISRDHAISDIEIVKKDRLEMLETGLTTGKVLNLFEKVESQLLRNSQNQDIYNQNIRKHLKVLEDISKAIEKLSKKMDKIR